MADDNIIEQIQNRTQALQNRPIYVYEMPASIAQETGISSIGLVELSGEEELLASKRSKNDAVRGVFESAKESLRQVNGKPVTTADGSSDKAWEALKPKGRQLVLSAYGELHNPSDRDQADFLKGRKVVVG